MKQRIIEDNLLWAGPIALDTPPRRTDLGDLPNSGPTAIASTVSRKASAWVAIPTSLRVMDVDHILPRAKGGTDHPDNLQLLCSGCNRSKGSRTMAEWRAAQGSRSI